MVYTALHAYQVHYVMAYSMNYTYTHQEPGLMECGDTMNFPPVTWRKIWPPNHSKARISKRKLYICYREREAIGARLQKTSSQQLHHGRTSG